MDYAIKTSAGTITVDHECTMRRLAVRIRELGVQRVNAKAIFPAKLHKTENSLIAVIAKMKGVSHDELAEQMAGQMIPSQRQTGALANPR